MPESLHAVESQIAAGLNHLAQLRKRRNAFFGLCKLPAEILGRILKLSQALGFTSDEHMHACAWERLDYSWLCLAVTCSHTWDVAVQERTLWSFVEWRGKNAEAWTAHSVLRAGVPLHMRAVSKGVRNKANDWAALYLPKARAAFVVPNMQERDGLQRLANVLRQPLPHIQILNYTHDGFTLNMHFLGGTSHTLDTLTLSKIEIADDTMPAFPGLRHLHLSSPLVHSYEPLFALIRQAPHLGSINIESVRHLPGAFTISTRDKVIISLPDLQSLCLRDIATAEVAGFLRVIPTPAQELVIVPTPEEYGRNAPESHPLTGHRAYIHERVHQFWAPHSGVSSILPGGTLTSTTKLAGCRLKAEYTLEYCSLPPDEAYPRLLYQTSVNPYRESVTLDGVRTFKLIGSPTTTTSELPALRDIVLESSRNGFDRYYPDFIKWVRERAQAGADIQTITFVKSHALFEEFGEQLKDIVPCVSSTAVGNKRRTRSNHGSRRDVA
jgi:hypothetical protein